MIKILFVGDSTSAQYVSAFYNAAMKIENIDAHLFDYGVFWSKKYESNFFVKLERHFRRGILTKVLNHRLTHLCKDEHYDIVFLYGTSMIYGDTVKRIKANCKTVFMYCNDNPFSRWYATYVWKNFRDGLKYCDLAYAYRESNIGELLLAGAPKANLLKSYYISERNFYIPDEEIVIDVPDVVYIGHKEEDDRQGYIELLLENGISVGLNHAWNDFEKNNPQITHFNKETSTKCYNEILNKAKIAIVFLSQINGDNYTRRCFEIPATKTMMIAPYTDTLASMYDENSEIVFFYSKTDFISKIKYYLEHEDERAAIAENGYLRLQKNGDESRDRIMQIINDYVENKNQ